jgi:hypothetical protein
MPVAFVSVVLLLHTFAFCDDFALIVDGVNQIMCPAAGGVWAISEGWIPIVTGDEDTSFPSIFIMAKKHGSGRIIMLGGGNLLTKTNLFDLYDTQPLVSNMFDWLRGGQPYSIAYTSGHGEWVQLQTSSPWHSFLQAQGYTITDLTGAMTPNNLSSHTVLMIGNAWQSFTMDEIAAVVDFVNNGGGILLVGVGWSWEPYHPGTTMDDYPMNHIASPFGARWLPPGINDPTNNENGSGNPIFHVFYPNTGPQTVASAFSLITAVNSAHAADLEVFLAQESDTLRHYLQAHNILRIPCTLSGGDQGVQVFNFYADMISQYPHYFKKTTAFDPEQYTVMTQIRERVHMTVVDSKEPTEANKARISSILGLTELYDTIWTQCNTLLLDNCLLDTSQKEYLFSLLTLIPSGLAKPRFISVYDLMGMPNDAQGRRMPSVDFVTKEGEGKVNIFGGKIANFTENSFPADSDAFYSPVFCLVAIHELNHTVNAWTIRMNETSQTRLNEVIRQACPTQLVFKYSGTPTLVQRVDWVATKDVFLSQGLWNGDEMTWQTAWNDFWQTGPGKEHEDDWLRNNMNLACDGPQEAFATLSNQYLADTATMLDLCLRRWGRGIQTCINQLLFFADVYSQGNNYSYFYSTNLDGVLTRTPVLLARNETGYITQLLFDGTIYSFEVDSAGNVISIGEHNYVPGDLNLDLKVDTNDLYLFSTEWLREDDPVYDYYLLAEDHRIDAKDFGILADNWFEGISNSQ